MAMTGKAASTTTPKPATVNGSVTPAPGARVMPLAPPTGPAKRRPKVFLAAAVAAVVAGGALAVWAVQTSGQRTAMIGISDQVRWGETITAADLVAVDVTPDTSLRTIPWSDRSSVIGHRAAVELLPGTLITPAAVDDDAAIPPAGQSVVGITVKSSQAPQQWLEPGGKVQLVIPGAESAGAGANTPAPPTLIDASILLAADTDASGSRTVDVLVASGSAPTVAVAAAAGTVSIVLVPRG